VLENMIEFIQRNYTESLPLVRASLRDSGREKGERGSGMAELRGLCKQRYDCYERKADITIWCAEPFGSIKNQA